jgi:enoyl-CoA hydratase/carnithine racemase
LLSYYLINLLVLFQLSFTLCTQPHLASPRLTSRRIAIGLFPDVGGSSWLPHLKDGFGAYIGMTGARVGPADLIHAGMATHYITR